MDDLLEREEIFWRQRSRENWLRLGDRNTKYFHLSTIINRRRLAIDRLKKEDGSWIDNEEEIRDTFVTYFSDIFTSTNPVISSAIKELLHPHITLEENEELCRVPTYEEVRDVVFQLGPLNAHGLDVALVQSLFNGENLYPEINLTNIALIPRTKAIARGTLHGIRIGRRCPVVSHLLFADDLLLFGRASLLEMNEVVNILAKFGSCSGQEVNYGKSGILFSKNLPKRQGRLIARSLGVVRLGRRARYLGMPLCIGHPRSESYQEVVDRIKTRLTGWRANCLSQMGRTVLINSVLSALPTYTMSVHSLPTQTCSIIETTMKSFFWNGHSGPGTDLLWQKACRPKRCGGLGIRKMKLFNNALLTKVGWRLMTEESFWSKLLIKKYVKGADFLTVSVGSSSSPFWKGLCRTRNLLQRDCCKRVGNGLTIKIWGDPWLPDLEGFILQRPTEEIHDGVSYVADLFTQSGLWNMRLISSISPLDVQQAITRIGLPKYTSQEDEWIWTYERDGNFSKAIWFGSIGWRPDGVRENAIAEWLTNSVQRVSLIADADVLLLQSQALVIWMIWLARNDVMFNGVTIVPERVIDKIRKFRMELVELQAHVGDELQVQYEEDRQISQQYFLMVHIKMKRKQRLV
ncbi:PREDICTED: uncharacterized protein LOC104593313 [Nelumbo nucifera]|uniref:Uncharacterized protein LOC104593313 n=1 Tax=Nelumbo nucifera TaxID=4432 RepID=A0A1U7ZSW0_NELNU|nr:PREDICTED: uncharacterized protein LOC104593313 [Nelumbo nucifera]